MPQSLLDGMTVDSDVFIYTEFRSQCNSQFNFENYLFSVNSFVISHRRS